jgi:hypothetical protein
MSPSLLPLALPCWSGRFDLRAHKAGMEAIQPFLSLLVCASSLARRLCLS